MKNSANIYRILIILSSLLLFVGLANAESKNHIRRFCFVAGANDGGIERVKLKYAVKDSYSFSGLLHSIGGISKDDSRLLVNPRRDAFLKELTDFASSVSSISNKDERTEFLFYYSGHSDEKSILLGNENVSYTEIRDIINRIDADVKIAILDSCSSGAFTRLKGGKLRSPFLVDAAHNMKGFAFMTSSSVDEASQESDRIRGSFFTHYLLTGLRGAADLNRDGKITLNEAYQFAYFETLAGTQQTLAGPQHPNYAIQMTGTGDVIMTDIRRSSSILVIPASIHGRLYVKNSNDILVCELRKMPGQDIELGLEEGDYTVLLSQEATLLEGELVLQEGEKTELKLDLLTRADTEYTLQRGTNPMPDIQKSQHQYNFEEQVWYFSPIYRKSGRENIQNRFVFNLFGSYSAAIDGFSFGFGPTVTEYDMTGFHCSIIGNYAGGNAEGLLFSNIFNVVCQDFAGVEHSGLFNINYGDTKGLQLASLFNMSDGETKWVQISGLFNTSGKDFYGFRISGLFNYGGNNSHGFSATGLFNQTVNDFSGVNIAGLYNISGGKASGFQAAGLFNYSEKSSSGFNAAGLYNITQDSFKGVNIAGLFNKADNITGAQIAPVNISKNVKGLQLGVINIAEESGGLPIGIINVSGDGGIELVCWSSTTMLLNTGFLFRSGYFYSIIAGSTFNSEFSGKGDSFGYSYYAGVQIPVSILFFSVDVGQLTVDNKKIFDYSSSNDFQVLQGRLSAGIKILNRISFFGGTSINYKYTYDRFKDGKLEAEYFGGVRLSVFGKNL